MQLAKLEGPVATMSSLEMVEYINSHEERNDLTHANFMAKVPKVLGDGGLIQFQDTYKHPQNGQMYPMYRFPKREACLMAMSYSYDLQAKVYDRMTELEAQQAPKVPQSFADALLLAGAQQKEIEQKALQIENLSTALDTLLDWVSILKIAKHNKVNEKKFDWRKLKSTSEQLGYTIKKAESPRYGYQNLYHLAAFKACYPQYDYSIKAD